MPHGRVQLCSAFGIVTGAILAACGSFSSTGTAPPELDAGALTDADAAPAVVDAGADTGGPVPSAPKLYVSPAGSDGAAGTKAEPLRSIGAALAYAATKPASTPYEILVCKGIYADAPLRVSVSVTLRGGYNCTEWTRAAGFPNAREVDPNESRIENNRVDLDGSTVLMTGPIKAELEGFTVVAGDGNTMTTSVSVRNGADSLVVRNRLLGGKTTAAADTVAGRGIAVETARADILQNFMQAGVSGGSQFFASASVLLIDAGGSLVESNLMRGGTGKAPQAETIVHIASKAPGLPVRVIKNELYGGTYSTSAPRDVSHLFIVYQSGSAIIEDNRAVGGTTTCAESCYVNGVYVGDAATVEMRRNQIEVGSVTAPDLGAAVRGAGVFDTASLTAENNVLLQRQSTTTAGTFRYGLMAYNACETNRSCSAKTQLRATFRHNTIDMGWLSPAGTTVTTGLYIGSSRTVAEANLFVGTSDTGLSDDRGVFIDKCNGAVLAPLRSNVWLTKNLRLQVDSLDGTQLSCSPTSSNFEDTNVLRSELTQVLRDPMPSSWSAFGASSALEAAPAGAADCTALKRPNTWNSSVAFDLLGRSRSENFTPGAFEYQGKCPIQ
jgi:hypothetical protein